MKWRNHPLWPVLVAVLIAAKYIWEYRDAAYLIAQILKEPWVDISLAALLAAGVLCMLLIRRGNKGGEPPSIL
jgi:hypothetical protein